MTDKAVCPDAAAIERLLLGRTSDAETDDLERHLLDCDRCCEVSRSLHLDDTMVAGLRRDNHLAAIAQEAPVRATMARLMALRTAAAASQPEETMTVAGESTDDAWGLRELLDPPQAEGELGGFAGYRVLRVLGAGGMGIVLEAEDPQLQRRVALKIMNRGLAARSENRQRFLREARAAAAIEHAHIVTVHQVGEQRGVPFLAMQLLKGESLHDRLEREGSGTQRVPRVQGSEKREAGMDNPKSKIQNPKSPLPLAECLRIGRETAEALAVAHQRGLIHRDIKPANIWLESPGGWVKLVDFGLAHVVEDEVHLTQTGAILGTPSYMSPEQARGDSVGPRSDLFSLGVVLYRLTTGQTPFQGRGTLAVLTALATADPRPVGELNPELPPAFADVIMRLLAKDPGERFESAEAVAEAIRAIEAAESEGARERQRDGARERRSEGEMAGRPPRRRSRWPLVAAAAAACFLLAGMVVVIRDKEGREVARINVPEGGSVATEESPASPAAPGRKLAGSTDAASRRATPTRSASEESAKAGPVPARRGDGSASPSPEGRPASPPSRRAGIGATLPDRAKPFLLVREGKQAAEFKTIAGALGEMQAGDAIEVYGNGPFTLPIVNLDGKPFTLRAGAGFRPRFVRTEGAKQQFHSAWITVNNAPLTLEGIELREDLLAHNILHGGGAPWEIRRCLLRRGDSHAAALLHYERGPHLRIVDSVLASGHSQYSIKIGTSAEVHCENNLYWSGGSFFTLQGGGQKLRFTRNTFAGQGTWLHFPDAEHAAVEVLAEENVFRVGQLLCTRTTSMEVFREVCRWNGRRNLHGVVGGASSLIFSQPLEGSGRVSIAGDDLAAWSKFWGEHEQGAMLGTTPTLRYEAAWLAPKAGDPRRGGRGIALRRDETPLPRLHHWLDPRPLDPLSPTTAGSEGDAGPSAAVGPDWRLVGPGEAYLRALADAGHPVTDEQLGLEGTEEGAVVLLHENTLARGYATVAEAVAAAADGDTVAIRANGTFPGFDRRGERQGKRLTLRAGYGYQPTIGDNVLLAPGDVWSIEDLHFSGQVWVANGAPAAEGQPAPRLLNCSFEPALAASGPMPQVTTYSESAPPLEVVNCLLPNGVNFAGARLRVVNSVIASVGLNPIEPQRPRALDLDRCVVWSNFSPAIQHGTVQLTVSARRTWFEFSSFLRQGDDAAFQWQGDENVYCHGAVRWQSDCDLTTAANYVGSLPAWQARWSSDAGSRQGDAVFIDPRFCGLLPNSPGHQAAQDGGDLGVDLSRLGMATPSDKVDPALRDGGASPSPEGRPTSPPRSVGATLPEPPPLDEWLKGREILTVAQDGSGQFKTIQAALDALKPHQVVKVLDRGPYREVVRADGLPHDTGLISDRQATIQLSEWDKHDGAYLSGHSFGPLDGFRLAGCRFVAPPHEKWVWASIIGLRRVEGLVVEDCYFGWTEPRPENRIDPEPAICLYSDDGQRGSAPNVVRNCFFNAAALGLQGPNLFVDRNFFVDTIIALSGPKHETRIRHNVLVRDGFVLDLVKIDEVTGFVEISNNTVFGAGFDVRDGAPRQGVAIRNNITTQGVRLSGEADKLRDQIFKNWLVDHNSYLRLGSLPKGRGDILEDPAFLSTEPGGRDYARIPADGPLASGGAGGDLPDYVGALPPGPAPKEGDWFTRLRERWQAGEDKVDPVPARRDDVGASPSPEGRPTSPPRTVVPRLPPTDYRLPTLADERAVAKWVVENGGTAECGDYRSWRSLPVRTVRLNGNLSVYDDSLARFRHCPRLDFIDLKRTLISDAGLVYLAPLSMLRHLDLRETDVSDAGVQRLAALKLLERLDLSGTRVSNAALPTLATAFPVLRFLLLEGTAITDAGLPALAALEQLDELDLSHTQVTDAGLARLQPLTGLMRLSLAGTETTDAGIDALHKALVDCWITGPDGRLHAPPVRDDDPDRTAAEALLERGFKEICLTADGVNETRCRAAADLPRGPFKVLRVEVLWMGHAPNIADAGAVGDAEIKLLARLRQLRVANLNGTQVTDRGLDCLKGLPKLAELGLSGCRRLTANALSLLATLPRLRLLWIDGGCCTPASLQHVAALAYLDFLHINGDQFADATLKRLSGLSNLRFLRLSGGKVSSAGLGQLASLRSLLSLDLSDDVRLQTSDLEGLAEVRGLEELGLPGVLTSPDVFRRLAALPRLLVLTTRGTKLGDDGCRAIAGLRSLEGLDVTGRLVTDAELAHLARLSDLRYLLLDAGQITDAGLAHLAQLSNLRELVLRPALSMSGAGLEHLHGLKMLKVLRLVQLPVTESTESGVAAFKAAVPGCSVDWPK
ncbi:MAG TPA: protein kinase [Pirellulales bacterium]|nr:protein kinase [Pirellulales bacterium]